MTEKQKESWTLWAAAVNNRIASLEKAVEALRKGFYSPPEPMELPSPPEGLINEEG